MRTAAVQFFATPFDLTRNLQTAERLIRSAAAQGARLIVLPELLLQREVCVLRPLGTVNGFWERIERIVCRRNSLNPFHEFVDSWRLRAVLLFNSYAHFAYNPRYIS